MEPIAFTSRLDRRDMFALGVRLSLLNSVSLTAMAAGPLNSAESAADINDIEISRCAAGIHDRQRRVNQSGGGA